jgi:hypothetical protein
MFEIEIELELFAKFIKDEYTDSYGHLLISDVDDGEFCLSSYKTVAEEYMSKRQKEIDDLEESEVK